MQTSSLTIVAIAVFSEHTFAQIFQQPQMLVQHSTIACNALNTYYEYH